MSDERVVLLPPTLGDDAQRASAWLRLWEIENIAGLAVSAHAMDNPDAELPKAEAALVRILRITGSYFDTYPPKRADADA